MAAIENISTMAHCAQMRAEQTPDSTAFHWFNDFDRIDTLNWSQLQMRARDISAAIHVRTPIHSHVMLCLPQGLEFIGAIFGVFFANCTAVPVYPPDSSRTLPRFLRIYEDSCATLIITTRTLVQKLEKFGLDISRLPLLCIEDIEADAAFTITLPQPDRLALVQYTSGTTSTPKGVMITHAQLLDNERAAALAYRIGDNPHLVSWLPFYHDLGLIGGIFFPVFNGIPATLLSPATFLRNPATWLRLISDTRATVSGAPNFAFELCATRIADEVIDRLDLSHWQTAVCGAEMIRKTTVEKFIARFERAGFSPNSFCASYGMAETTLYMASANYTGPQFATSANSSMAFANCGNVKVGDAAIVDPKTRHKLPDCTVGEIWIRTPSMSHGYWRQPELTQQAFNVALADNSATGYFRSGDLGFMQEGNLYITGRLKELIILRGKNYSPQEIENIALGANPVLTGMQCSAFSIEDIASEKLIVVQEVNKRALNEQPVAHLEADIRLALRGALAVEADDIVFVKHNSLPRTSSGKLQRMQIRSLYQQGELEYFITALNSEPA